MNILAFSILLVFATAWIILPLVPALRELFRPTDVEPLTMVGRDNADIARFARNFRDYLQGQLAALDTAVDARGEQTGKLPDNTPFMHLARVPNEISRTTMPPGATGRLLVLDQSTVLDGGEQFRLEVWSREDFIGGPGGDLPRDPGRAECGAGARNRSSCAGSTAWARWWWGRSRASTDAPPRIKRCISGAASPSTESALPGSSSAREVPREEPPATGR